MLKTLLPLVYSHLTLYNVIIEDRSWIENYGRTHLAQAKGERRINTDLN